MSLLQATRAALERSIDLFAELAAALPEEALARKLPGLPSNPIGAQLWCVVGARESHARAIREGRWQGFSCSLGAEDSRRADRVAGSLERSGAALLEALDETRDEAPGSTAALDSARSRLVIDVLEHEAAHQGQLIRYLYALRLPIPPGWKERYALD